MLSSLLQTASSVKEMNEAKQVVKNEKDEDVEMLRVTEMFQKKNSLVNNGFLTVRLIRARNLKSADVSLLRIFFKNIKIYKTKTD